MRKKHINVICFIVLNILIFLIFLPWLKGHYATDSYNIINLGYKYYSVHYSLIDGRIFMFLIMQLADAININFEALHFILLSLALLVSNISVLIVKNIILKSMKNINIKTEIFSYMLAYTFIYNFLYIENLYFLECFVMSVGILLNLVAAKIFANKGKTYIFKTSLLVVLSAFCYQGTISCFIAFVILLEALKKQPLKNLVKNIIFALIITGTACIFNFAFVKVISNYLGLAQTRLNNSILYNIMYILIYKLNIIIHLSNNYFYGLFLISIIMLIALFIYGFNFKTNKETYLIFFVFLILGIIFCTDLPYLVSLSAYYAARTRFVIGALCSILVIYIFYNFDSICKECKKIIQYFLHIFIAIYFIFNIINYIEIINTSILVNKCEQEYVKNIDTYISKYELENNTTVEKVQLVYDANTNNAFFSNYRKVHYITYNACSCSWSAIGAINFYSNRNLTPQSDNIIETKMDELYQINDDVLYLKIAIL